METNRCSFFDFDAWLRLQRVGCVGHNRGAIALINGRRWRSGGVTLLFLLVLLEICVRRWARRRRGGVDRGSGGGRCRREQQVLPFFGHLPLSLLFFLFLLLLLLLLSRAYLFARGRRFRRGEAIDQSSATGLEQRSALRTTRCRFCCVRVVDVFATRLASTPIAQEYVNVG